MARREYKYLIDERLADRLRREIEGICAPDEHAGASGRYVCDTLYLDTLALDLYRATVDNERVREKLRVRTYVGAPAQVFLEVKRRIGDVIVKARAAVPGASWAEILETGKLERVPAKSRLDAERFFLSYHGGRRGPLVPQVIVRYEREPYASTIDDYARVTFDRKIVARPVGELAFDAGARGWWAVDHPIAMRTGGASSFVVLELKFSGSAPAWMSRIVRRLELPRLSFSKYARAIETVTIHPGLRIASL